MALKLGDVKGEMWWPSFIQFLPSNDKANLSKVTCFLKSEWSKIMKKTEIVIGNQMKHLSKISRFFGELDSDMKEIQKNYEKNPEKL